MRNLLCHHKVQQYVESVVSDSSREHRDKLIDYQEPFPPAATLSAPSRIPVKRTQVILSGEEHVFLDACRRGQPYRLPPAQPKQPRADNAKTCGVGIDGK